MDDREAAPRALVADRVYGAIGTLAVLLALFFLLRGGPEDGAAAPGRAPALRILAPAPGAAVAQPVSVVLDAGAPLEHTKDGWGSGGRHLHLRAGAAELMAMAPGDLQPLGGTRYRWTLPALPPGTHALRLLWSDARHRPLAEGASASVVVRVAAPE